MKKKLLAKKTLSVFLAVLMLMSTWVFFPGMVTFEAEASATDATYRENTDKYGTPYWSPNSNNTRWMLWGNSRSANDAHFYMEVPKTIYLDVSETLQSAGYKIAVEWSYGNSTSFRIAIGPAVWGYGAGSAVNNGSQMLTMTNLFSDYDSDVSLHAGAENEYGVNGYNDANKADLRQDDTFDGNRGVITLKNMGSASNKYNNIYLKGKPTGVGRGTYSTTEVKPDFILTQKWGSSWGRNTDAIDMEGNKPNAVSEKHTAANGGQYEEVWWNIEIYDKAPLKAATDNATNIIYDNTQYQAYVLNNGLSNLKTLRDQGWTVLTVREQTNDTIQAKAAEINNAAIGLQFQAKNAELKNKVAEAEALQAKANYNLLYTQASRQNLERAIEAATTNALYNNTTVYGINVFPDAGARAHAEQTTINNLINGINEAIAGLTRKYDIGYDNLFSLTDWALNPVKANMSNGTLEIDSDRGTIKITHDGSAEGIDNNTSQGTGADWYKAKVKGDTEYVLTWETEGSGRAQIHVFYATENSWTRDVIPVYNGNDAYWFVQNGDLPYSTEMGKHEVTFKTLPATDGLVFRFGTSNAGDSVTFSDIRLVEKSVYDAYAKNYALGREVFTEGDTKSLTYTPVRDGYTFDGWYKADGTKVTDVSGFSASDVVYAHWIQNYTVTFKNWDGTVLKTQEVAPGADATAPQDPSRKADADYEYDFARWDNAFTNVQADLVITAEFTSKNHTGISKTYASPANCTSAAKYTQFCEACGYVWNEVFDDVDMPALGHTYERENPSSTVVTGTSTGKTDDDVHTIKCNACDATTTVKHNFIEDANHPATEATCVIAGKIYYKCACLEEKTVEGSTNPNKHVNTEIINKKDAECGVAGYTGDTYCNDCKKTVATGSAIEALEHKYTNYVYNEGTATCFTNGTETATCDLCGVEKHTREAANTKFTHKYTNYVYNEGTAKCEVNGTETAYCDHGCNTTDTREAANTALAHDYTGAVKDNDNGTHSFLCKNNCGNYGGTVDCSTWTPDGENCKCTVCGYTKAHAWGDWSQDSGNTGDAAGKHTHTCDDCSAVESPDCVYTFEKTEATCEENAYTTYTCATCGHGYTVIHANTKKGHDFTGDYKYDAENDKHQQLCANGCGNYGADAEKDAWAACVWTYKNKEAGKHTASCVCGNKEEQTCTGGTATCIAQAVCQFCNTAYGDLEDHKYDGNTYFDGVVKAKDATCTAPAEYYVYCSVCKNEYTTEETFKYGDLLPHTYTGNTEYLHKATEAKCEVNETYYTYCSACKASSKGTDAEDTFEKEGSALTHKFDGTTVCNGDGTHTITCSQTNAAGWTCIEIENFDCAETADILGIVSADCLNAGYTMYQCKLCDYEWNVENEEAPALGHEYTKVVYNTEAYIKEAANCEHGTIYWYACEWCDANAKDETDTEKYPVLFVENTLDKRAHDWKNVTDDKYLAEGATCFAAAWYYSSCSYADCAKSAKDVEGEATTRKFQSGAALAHNWTKVEDAKYLVKAADCVNDATYYYECSLCKNSSKDYDNGSTWAKENSKSGHAMTHTAANDATCDAAGNYEYWYCSTCNKYFKDAEGAEAYLGQSATVIKKREHDLESFKATAPSCEVDGHPTYVDCKYEDCNYTTLPAVLPNGYKATGHNFTGTWTYDEVHLYHSKLCANGCGKSGMVIDGVQTEYKVELDVVDYVITGGEKCDFTYKAETKDGVHTHANSCVCGNGNTRVYSDEETFVEKVAPTCTAKGYDRYACPDDDCGETWTKNEVDAFNHLPAEKATSNNDGTHSVYCTREGCNYKISTEKCSGGTATCKDKAVCEKCGTAYGTTSDHTFTAEWAYQNDATCGVNGTEKNTCDVCKTEVTREAKDTALEHKVSEYVYELPEGVTIKDFDASALKEPTCKEDGFAVRYCTLGCGYYQTKTVAKDNNAHIWETDENGELVWKDHQGDCATGVTMKNYCTVCGKEQKKTEAGEHKWEIKLSAEPNCVDKGYRVWRCSTCKFTFDEFYGYKGEYLAQIEALGYSNEDLAPLGEEGHSYINTGKNKPATCTESEKETWQCVHCDEYDYRDIEGAEELGHKLNHYDAQAADCVFEGNVEYYRCSRCDLMFADENATETLTTVTIPTTDHADNDGDGKCDECYRVIYSNEDGEGSCGCICHKENFLMRILYKILNFFWKLFKISKTCECGAVHW